MSHKTRIVILGLLLSGLTLGLYWPTSKFQFLNYDDEDYVVNNGAINRGWSVPGLKWAFKERYASNWHPITWVSHMNDCQLYGLSPKGHHLTNVALHSFNSVLLLLFLWRTTGAVWRSFGVASLFAWHPLHVESVAWISERKDVLSALFFFLTLLAYAAYVRFKFQNRETGKTPKHPNSKLFYAASVLLFALGLMSKGMVVSLPFVLLLLDIWPLRRLTAGTGVASQSLSEFALRNRGQFLRLLLEKIPFFLLSIAGCAVTVWAQGVNGYTSLGSLPLSTRLANALVSYALYLSKTFDPSRLAVLYPYAQGWTVLEACCAGVLVVGLTALSVRQITVRPFFAVGWFWFLGMLVPVIGILQVGLQQMADRYTYLPLIGIFIILAWGSEAIVSHFASFFRSQVPRLSLAATSALALSALVISTHSELKYWHDGVRLFARDIEVAGESVFGEYALGVAYERKGKLDDAVSHFKKAVELKPNAAEDLRAWQVYSRMSLGRILVGKGQFREAAAQYTALLEKLPGRWQIHEALGDCFFALSREGGSSVRSRDDSLTARALNHYKEAARINPESSTLWRKFGVALNAEGRDEDALEAYREALRLNPTGVEELNDLAWFLATDPRDDLRNGVEALKLAHLACELSRYNVAGCLGTLDAAYAESGDFSSAIKFASEAEEVARRNGQSGLADAAASRKALYQQGKRYRAG